MNTTEKISVTDKLLSSIKQVSSPLWGEIERGLALIAFTKQGIPNRKTEEYKYCKIDLILKDNFSLNSSESIIQEQLSKVFLLKEAIKIVVVNGAFNAHLSSINSLPKGVTICSLKEAEGNHAVIFQKHFSKYADINADPFVALNTTLVKDGAFIHIEKNTIVENPVQIIHISTASENTINNPRNLIVAEQSSQAKIIETFVSIDVNAKMFGNALSEIVMGEQACLAHYKLQDENMSSSLVNTTQVIQSKGSTFTTNNITLNGGFVRNNLNIVLNGQGIESNLFGLYIPHKNQVVDNHTLVDHQQPNCNSNELYKGIINDDSTATFNGKIFVRKDAQKTNAFQSNKNILLSDDATVNTKPQLEIYADDVKCSHGTSTGKLDDEQLFYLRARGLSEASAKKLLMFAYASEVLEKIEIDELREYVENRLMEHFL